MYLLDTNILSELVRKSPSSRLLTTLSEQPAASLWTSVVCVVELRRGAALRSDRELFWKRIEREILSRVTVLAFDVSDAILTGDLYASQERAGTLIGLADLMIASTAMENGLAVVTANTRHFRRIPGLRVENWLER